MPSSLTQDYTYQFLDTGIILNTDVVPTAPFTDVQNVSGLDSADYRTTERQREGMDGGFVDAVFEQTRTIVIDGVIYSPPSQIDGYIDSLKLNYSPNALPQPFYFQHPGIGIRTIFCKSLGLKSDITTGRRIGQEPFQIQLKAEDPSIYGTSISVNGTVAVASSGRGYNKGFNYGYGATLGSGGAAVINNVGNKPAKGTIRITNVLMPTIVNDTTGDRLGFNINVNDPDFLDIDLRNKRVILNGTANRRGTLIGGSSWFLFPPGATTLRLLGTAGVGTPNMLVTYAPAYR